MMAGQAAIEVRIPRTILTDKGLSFCEKSYTQMQGDYRQLALSVFADSSLTLVAWGVQSCRSRNGTGM